MCKKAVIVLSGGMDSGVLLAELWHSQSYKEIHALTFQYGSNHNERELEKANVLVKKYKVTHKIIDLDFIGNLFKSSLLEGADAIPEGHYAAVNMKSTVVPFRNGIMLAIAAGYADSIEADHLFIGSHSGDHFVYPDCRPNFNIHMEAAVAYGTSKGVELFRPYEHITKRAIGLKGNSLAFDFSDTYTCYKGREKHCGKCGACVERKQALEGFDTTEYES